MQPNKSFTGVHVSTDFSSTVIRLYLHINKIIHLIHVIIPVELGVEYVTKNTDL